jgi:hypothetical protein
MAQSDDFMFEQILSPDKREISNEVELKRVQEEIYFNNFLMGARV